MCKRNRNNALYLYFICFTLLASLSKRSRAVQLFLFSCWFFFWEGRTLVRFRGSCVALDFLNQKYLCKQFHVLPECCQPTWTEWKTPKSTNFSEVQCICLAETTLYVFWRKFSVCWHLCTDQRGGLMCQLGLATDFMLIFTVVFLPFFFFSFLSDTYF